jgi:hypothetical protein
MTKAVSLARSVSDTGLLLDGDLAAIAALSGTSGLLKKTAANIWSLDTSSYLTSITSTNVTTALGYTPENPANKAQANGYASLDGSGKVPASQLPSYVDDVLEYANAAARPVTGETGKLYLTLDNNKVYRWSGSTYVEIVASPSSTDSVTEGTTNLYYTNTRVDTRLAATSINALSDVDTATSAPSNGQGLIWNSTSSQWVPGNVTANLTGSTTRTLTTITATSGQTMFTASGGYTVGYVDVYQNGIKLVAGDDFTATNGTTVVLTQGANVGDTVEIVAYQLATIVSTAGPKAGGGIIVNRTVIDENYTFPSNHNGFSIGPVVVANGVTVSIPSGQRWLVV